MSLDLQQPFAVSDDERRHPAPHFERGARLTAAALTADQAAADRLRGQVPRPRQLFSVPRGAGGGSTIREVKISNAVRIGADAADANQSAYYAANGPFLVGHPMHINTGTQQYEPDLTVDLYFFPPDHILVDRFQIGGESIFTAAPGEPTFYIADVPPRGLKLLFGEGLALIDAPNPGDLCTGS